MAGLGTPRTTTTATEESSDSALVAHVAAHRPAGRGRQVEDARAKMLTLTEEGHRLAEAVADALRDVEQGWAELVGDGRLADVRSTLDTYVSDGSRSSPTPGRRRQRRVRLV